MRLVDITTGEEVKNIYNSKQEPEPITSRTGKAVVKKELTTNNTYRSVYTTTPSNTTTTSQRRVVNLDQVLDK